MTVYVYIWKTAENAEGVDYAFSPDDGVQGLLRIELATGQMHLLQPCPGDDNKTFYQCACKAVWNAWAVKKLPQSTCYIYG